MATLTAKNLAKAYKGRRVVEDVSLTVNSGEIVGLLGPNGAGKTTTFYMVVGIVPRDAGNIIIDDDDISLLPLHARARRGIGYLPQEASIFRRLSVYDNLISVCLNFGVMQLLLLYCSQFLIFLIGGVE